MSYSVVPFSGLTFTVHTFGCQMNKHDSERVCGMMESLGASEVATVEDADIIVFMTCCVREAADVRLYGQISSLKNVPLRKDSPLEKRIVAVGGCIGQRDGDKLVQRLPHLDVVFGTNNLSSLPMLIREAMEDKEHHVAIVEESNTGATELPIDREHAWAAWLPITVGCNNFCTYCIVPYVRGREKSRPLEQIAAEAQAYVDAGVKEITLLGQNVNSYGRDLYGEPRFAEVLDAVAETGVDRIRFATSHPKDLTDEVIKRFSTIDTLMPALHLPAQSGSNRILTAMNRRYSIEHYRELVDKIRAVRPGIALSTDIIVGFPGETEDDFQQTYDLVKQVGYAQVFTFIYSKRAGTPAADMEDTTPREVVQERFDRLVDAVQENAYAFNQGERGTVVPVLVEGPSKRNSSLLVGKSPKNQTVHAPLPHGASIGDLVGKFVGVRVEQARTWYLKGKVVSDAYEHERALKHTVAEMNEV